MSQKQKYQFTLIVIFCLPLWIMFLYFTNWQRSFSQVSPVIPNPVISIISPLSPLQYSSVDSPIITPTPLPTPFATLVPTPPTMTEGNFSITGALTIMYYNAPDVIIQQGVPYYSSPYNTPYTSTININIAAPYSDQGQEKYVVITDKAIEHCHPCPAILDGAIFSKIDNNWHLDIVQRDFLERGENGLINKGQLIKIGPDKYGISLISHAAGQGYESERITILSEIGRELDVVFEIFSKELQNDFDKQNNPIKRWGYISQINVISNRQSASDYWDIEVISEGTDRENKIVDRVQTYKFSGTKYILLPE